MSPTSSVSRGGRDLIVVDVETTGLDVDKHWALEVAAVNVTTGEEYYFVPALPQGALDEADGLAMKINGYFARDVYAHRMTGGRAEGYWRQLWQMLKGNTLAGSNPTFDAAMLNKAAEWGTIPQGYGANKPPALDPSPWHHRLADLAAYAAGALLIPPTSLPGLEAVCELLGVTNEEPHSAMGDARATAKCFRVLEAKADARLSEKAVAQ